MAKGCCAWLCCASMALFLSTSGCGRPATALSDTDDDTTARSDAIQVQVVTPQRVEMTRTTRQPATVHADQQAEVYAKVTGYVDELKVDIGAEIAKGDVLAIVSVPEMMKQRLRQAANVRRLEAEERRAQAEVDVAAAAAEKSRAQVKKTQASLTASQIERQRMEDLVNNKAVADRLLDESVQRNEEAEAVKSAADEEVKLAVANLALSRAMAEAAAAETEVARRELDELDEMMKFATLTAPFDGLVTARNVDIGDLVRNSQSSSANNAKPLFVVAKLDKIRVRVAVPERDSPLIDKDDIAHILLPALGGETIDAQVSRTAGGLDETTRTMLVEIDLPNEDRRLLPGMFGQATIDLEANKSRLVLPANVVRYDEHGKSYVYVVNQSSSIDVVDVKTGWDDGEQVEITDGLSGDERVVTPMLRRLTQGQSVTVED